MWVGRWLFFILAFFAFASLTTQVGAASRPLAAGPHGCGPPQTWLSQHTPSPRHPSSQPCLLSRLLSSAVDLFMSERRLVVREVRGGYYRPATYLLAKAVLDALLLRVIPVFLYAAPFYPMVSGRGWGWRIVW